MTAVATVLAHPAHPRLRRALPPTLRHLPVPDTDPPLELAIGLGEAAPQCAEQGVLTLLVAGEGPEQEAEEFGPQPTPTRELPDPALWSRQLVQVVVEVMTGQRPQVQLLRWTCESVYQDVLSQTLPPPRPGTPLQRRRPRVRTVRVCEPADGVAEVSAVVLGQYRAQAIALRLEGRDGRWLVTALEAG